MLPPLVCLSCTRRRSRSPSLGPTGAEHRGDGLEADADVVPERPLVDVLEVELHPTVEVDLVAAADLPDAGDAGLHGEAAARPPRSSRREARSRTGGTRRGRRGGAGDPPA